MKKALSVLLCLCLVLSVLTALPFTASAATLDEAAQSTGASSGTTGDCTWTLDDDGVLTISGNGAMGKYNINTAPWGENITSVIINDGVTNIGQDAFYGCYGLTRVTIGKGVTSIDPYAFYNCIGLTSITIPDSVTSIGDQAFHSCYYLKSVTLGNGVKRIGDYSFSWCEDLNQITIPYSVSDIGYGAFEGCTHITEIYIPDSVTKIRDRAFAECELSVITVDGNNKKYDSRNNCNAIIETETNSLISGCKNTVIPDSVTWIDNSAFYGCQNLTNIVIPDSVTGIDEWAFYCCKKLSRITIPTTTTTIFQSSFAECGLSNIIVKEGNPVYDSRNNCNAIIETKSNTLFFGSENTIIPNSVTSIGDEAFSGCSQITNISIPNSVTSIGDYAFYECESLTSISIPDSVRSIGNTAFSRCYSLISISISNSVTVINNDTFGYCYNLTNITIPSSVTRIGMNAFLCCFKLDYIHIPDSVISIGCCAFQETGWFKNQPNGLVYAGKVAYMIKGDCPTEIEIKSGTLGIADMAFEDFENITSVSIPPTLKNIGERAFLGCSALSSVKIPNSVISIGRMAFCGCLSSNSIIIPDSVETIGQWAFGYGLGPQKIDGFTIYGYTGSEAQKYSNHYGFPFIALDLNDTEKPVVSLSSTNSVAASQTVTLSLNDNKGVKGYYWGTSASYSNNSYTTSSSTSVSKAVDSAGTYYATAVDTSGNVSSTVSITFYKTTLNANGGSVSPSSVLTKSGNSFTFPTPTRSDYTYVGWSTSSTATSGVKTLSPSSNATYYAVWSNADSQKPTVSLSSTNNVAASQTVTISMSDNVGIKGYYWGTSSTYSNNSYTTSSSTSVTKTVSASGTYYVMVVDTSGNVSDNKSITFFQTTLNANGGSVNPTSVLTKSGNSFTFPTPTRSNYTYVGWSTSSTAASGVKTLSPSSNATYYAVWSYVDSQKPTVSLSSTNNVASSQTVTISLSDNVGINGYYWGTSSTYSNNSYTTSSSTSVTKTVSASGTYYVTAVDTSGNVSDSKSITFYKTTLNANGGSVSPTSVLTKAGNSFTFPTPARSNYTYVGWSTSSSATSGAKTLSPTSSLTYYAVWKTNSSFVWGQDNWNFKNSAPTYFPSSTYRKQINNTYLNKLKTNLTNSEYQAVFEGTWYSSAWLDDWWGGSCYGMSSLTLLSKAGMLPYSSYQSGATKLYDLGYPKNNSNLLSLITYYQMLQVKGVIQQQYRTIPNKTNQENITNLINLLDKNSTVLVGFQKAGWGGHAILATGYEYGSWTFNGVSYQGCIRICDPNASTSYNTRNNIYFNTKSYNWTIPAYSNMTSTAGAKFNYIGATVNEINEGGYLSGSSGNRVEAFVARIDATAISDNRSVSKVENTNGVYMNQSSQPNEIVEDYSFILGNESEGTIGYNLYDANSSYKISQSNAEKLQLYMDYENCSLTGGSAAGESVIFDKSGYVEVNGESAMYNMSMTYDETYPTDWFTIQVQGYNANSASLRMVNDGYVLTADNLENVSLRANNRKTYAQAAFTTEYNSVFIYEIDENTIGLKVDTDNNGTYETELPTDTFEIGDTNGDGIVNIRDVTAIQRHLADLDILTGTSFLVADTNGDGTVSIDDATHLQMYLAEFDVILGKQN